MVTHADIFSRVGRPRFRSTSDRTCASRRLRSRLISEQRVDLRLRDAVDGQRRITSLEPEFHFHGSDAPVVLEVGSSW